MTVHRFLSVVPRAARIAAFMIGTCVVAAGLVAAVANRNDGFVALPLYSLGGVVLGLVVTTWILSVGFVYADAKRRAMRPILWAALVILFPHLLGFLLYFVLRQPPASVCLHCGQTVSPMQRFCSWCGALQAVPASTTGASAQTGGKE